MLKLSEEKKELLGKHSFSKQKFDINVVKEGLSKIYELLHSGFYWKFKTPRTECSVLTFSHTSAYKGYFVCVGATLAQPTEETKNRQQPGISQECKLERISSLCIYHGLFLCNRYSICTKQLCKAFPMQKLLPADWNTLQTGNLTFHKSP